LESSAHEKTSLKFYGAIAATASFAALFIPFDAEAYHQGSERMTQYTAHTLRAGEAQLGLLELDYAPLDWLYFGTETLPYAAGIFFPIVVPNVQLKVRPIAFRPFTLAVRGGFYYASLRGVADEGGGSAFLVPISAYASSDITDAFSLHGEVTYTRLIVTGDATIDELTIQGGGIANTVQLGLMGEYRVTRVTALTLRARWQVFQSPLQIHSSSQSDAFTTQTVNGDVTPEFAEHAWAILAGVALSWKNVSLQLAVGYGDLFAPSLGAVLPYKGIVPDANFFVRF
jgi:hypothetical protein